MESSANCTSLGDIVTEYLIAAGYESKQNYPRLLDMAIRGLKEIHYDVSGVTVWTPVQLDEFNRYCIPNNIVKLISFWIESKNGLIPIADSSNSVLEKGNPFTYYKNEDSNTWEFSTNVPPNIVIQYLADPTKVNDKYSVHPFIADALLQYLWYADSRFKASVPEGAKAEMQRKYVAAKNWAHIRLTSQGKDDLVNSRNKAYSRLPK